MMTKNRALAASQSFDWESLACACVIYTVEWSICIVLDRFALTCDQNCVHAESASILSLDVHPQFAEHDSITIPCITSQQISCFDKDKSALLVHNIGPIFGLDFSQSALSADQHTLHTLLAWAVSAFRIHSTSDVIPAATKSDWLTFLRLVIRVYVQVYKCQHDCKWYLKANC